MKITRERLKSIIAEEIDKMSEGSETPGTGKAPVEKTFNLDGELEANKYGMGAISEVEEMDLVQQFADLMYNSGLTAIESPKQAREVIMGLGKAALLPLFTLTTGYSATSLKDAIDYLRNKGQKSEEK